MHITLQYLFCKSDGLGCKVHLELEDGTGASARADNVEYASLDCLLARLHPLLPVFKQLLGVELGPEGVAILLQLLSLHMVLPALAKDSLNTLEVGLELTINLRCV